MVVDPRDLPGARAKRYAWHVAAGLATAISIWIAAGARSALGWETETCEAATRSIAEHRSAADGVAAECSIEPFSDETALESFPVRLPAYPTKREKVCIDRVTQARADLIQDHLDLKQARIRETKAAAASRMRTLAALILAGVWLAGIWVGEIRGRLGRKR